MRDCLVVLCVVVAALAGTGAVAVDRPRGTNCDLPEPPKNSGLETNRTLLKIYPRAKDIRAAYTGCQSVWFLDKNGWELLETSYYDRGQLKTYYAPARDKNAAVLCTYRAGVLESGGSTKCTHPRELPRQSLPPECMKALETGKYDPQCSRYE